MDVHNFNPVVLVSDGQAAGAGFVGGMKADGLGSAIIAAILPSIVLGGRVVFLAATLNGLPLVAFIAAAGGLVPALSQVVLLLVGAIVDGLFA